MKTLVLMPTYNEAAGIVHSLEHLLQVNQEVDVLIIDDNSPDGTADLVEKLSKSSSRVSLLKREGKEGLGKAYLAGYGWGLAAGYQRLVQMDADGSHRPEDLSKLLESESPLVIGSRWVIGGSGRELAASQTADQSIWKHLCSGCHRIENPGPDCGISGVQR